MVASRHVDVPVSYNNKAASVGEVMAVSVIAAKVAPAASIAVLIAFADASVSSSLDTEVKSVSTKSVASPVYLTLFRLSPAPPTSAFRYIGI